MDQALIEFFQSHFEGLEGVINSNFFSAAFGAFAGAFGAQRIAERAKRREENVLELRSTNTAIMISFDICNILLSVKKQHLRPMKVGYENDRAAFIKHVDTVSRIGAGVFPPFFYTADMKTLFIPPLPVERLAKEVYEKASHVGRPLSLMTMLGQSVETLAASMDSRNRLCEEFQHQSQMPQIDRAFAYFGVQKGNVLNETYLTTLYAIFDQADDGIMFAKLLIDDLVEHGNKLATKMGIGTSSVNKPDFSIAVNAGLMPDAARYTDWLTAFKKGSSITHWADLAAQL
ncbi:hypothetical protein [Emcibacter sp. SYSU 3D8]|uniref:hypothetical protein n=1 Tax=Emcibacter sp. SYSU 3D8 TaxID=3133969 RepID=UPI0031FE67C2